MRIVLTATSPEEEVAIKNREVVIADAREFLLIALAVHEGVCVVHPQYWSGTLEYLFGQVSVIHQKMAAEIDEKTKMAIQTRIPKEK
jgi:hypothetical protein